MSEEQRQAVVKAQKIAFKALRQWMDAHITYQLEYVHSNKSAGKKRPREEAPAKEPQPRPQYTGCGPECAGNVVAGTPCPLKSEASPGAGVRHGGKTHAVCDECRKAVRALRRKKARAAKKGE